MRTIVALLVFVPSIAMGAPTRKGVERMQLEQFVASLHPMPGRVDATAVALASLHSGSYVLAAPLVFGATVFGPSPVTSASMIDPYVPVDGTMNVTGAIEASTTITGTNFIPSGISTDNDRVGVVASSTTPATADLYLQAGTGRSVYTRLNGVSGLTVAAASASSRGEFSNGFGTGNNDAVYAGGTLSVITTAVGNVGAGEDTLISFTLPANSLVTTNRGIRVHARGTAANNSNAKTIKCKVGTQIVVTNAPTVSVAGEIWAVDYTFTRTALSAQDWETTYTGNTGVAGAFIFDPEIGTATQTETGTLAVHCTGEAVDNNDIVMEFQSVTAF